MQPKRFSEFAKDEGPLAGEKIKIDAVLNREIKVLAYKARESKFSRKNSETCLMLQVELDGEKRVIFTGSSVLADQVDRYKEELPFLATIIKIDKYYTFS
jgi:hypothetical protein